MTKQCHTIYPQIYDLFNLWQAFKKASAGRRSQPCVAHFEYNLEAELIALRDELREETYQPGGYCSFTIHEPKRRKISAAPFRDRVVHHALINVIRQLCQSSGKRHTPRPGSLHVFHAALPVRSAMRCEAILPLD